MQSVPELRRRIDELSSAVNAQTQVLRDLETSKSQAQSELNAILDPMARLPLEISSDIFKLCVGSGACRPHYNSSPVLFLRICRLWGNIALSTPSLWADIYFDRHFPDGQRFARLCDIYINRARALPLSFEFDGSLELRGQRLMGQYAHRLRDLKLFILGPEDLRQILPVSFPSLKTLTVSADNWPQADFPNAEIFVEILRSAPELLECEFDEIIFGELDSNLEPWTHACLQALRLGKPQDCARNENNINTADILRYLTLPALKKLDISYLDISSENFISFLTRSSPPLQSFRLLELFCPSPDRITHATDDGNLFLPFLEMLGSARNFLPNLSELTLRGYIFEPEDYDTLIGALTARRASGYAGPESFSLIFSDYNEADDDDAPDDDVIVALQQLVEEGMNIHVGPEDQNFI
ncbi:hypothetical protein B0H13DRAFT_2672428 [Mycena leptocephala]|nr:hypothetical protein B0H13DRAFT_2672428 [Mycena leptocephala]